MHRLLLLFILALGSCTFFDNGDLTPMYFKIESAGHSTTVEQGLPTHNIRDISVYADGFSIGVFNMPVDVPVLMEADPLRLDLVAVVRNNGIASNPVEYPFYKPIGYTFDFEGNKTVELTPVFEYNNLVKFVQVADFEGGNPFSVDTDGREEISIERSTDTPYGNFCGTITLDTINNVFAKSTFSRIDRSMLLGGPVFLEMDYRNEIPFTVGIVRIETGNLQVPFLKVGLTPQPEWNKVYIELTGELNDNLIEEFTILVANSPENTQTGTIWIDNVKLVHF